jgi:hypothetical protein
MPTPRETKTDALEGLGALALSVGVGVLLARSGSAGARTTEHSDPPLPTVKAARRLNRAAGLIATSTLLDSAIEHYRGSFHNKAMFTPLVASALTLAVSIHGTGDKRPAVHKVRDMSYLAAALTGIAGTLFHLYNVGKRPGGFSWQNLFYGSPLGAPAAVAISGLLGYYSERLRENESDKPARVFGLRAGRALAALSSLSMIATAAEAGLLHLRGAFHNPFMYIPVTVPPIAAALLGETATNHPKPPRRLTRWWLRLTALVGFAGAGFHIFGVHRNMGGWHDWRQNMLNGPPIPAPPSFTGVALAGLAALRLLVEHDDA